MRKSKLVGMMLVVALLLNGCGGTARVDGDYSTYSKEDLLSELTMLQQSYEDKKVELEQTQETLKQLSEDGTVTPAITTTGDGTGRFIFNSKDSKIIFPSSFVYPGSESMLPDGKINIVSTVTVRPSSTWISRINGSALELENTSTGISGTIKVNNSTQVIEQSKMEEEVLKPWFDQMKLTTVTYTDIFADQNIVGKQAETPIMINSESAYLICGMALVNGVTVTYIFVYRGNMDITKSDLVKTILNSITIEGSELTVQK